LSNFRRIFYKVGSDIFLQLIYETLVSENNGGEIRKMPNDNYKYERRTAGGNFLNKSKKYLK